MRTSLLLALVVGLALACLGGPVEAGDFTDHNVNYTIVRCLDWSNWFFTNSLDSLEATEDANPVYIACWSFPDSSSLGTKLLVFGRAKDLHTRDAHYNLEEFQLFRENLFIDFSVITEPYGLPGYGLKVPCEGWIATREPGDPRENVTTFGAVRCIHKFLEDRDGRKVLLEYKNHRSRFALASEADGRSCESRTMGASGPRLDPCKLSEEWGYQRDDCEGGANGFPACGRIPSPGGLQRDPAGGGLIQGKLETLKSCQSRCSEYPYCQSYTHRRAPHNSDLGECYLSTTAGIFQPSEGGDNVVSGTKYPRDCSPAGLTDLRYTCEEPAPGTEEALPVKLPAAHLVDQLHGKTWELHNIQGFGLGGRNDLDKIDRLYMRDYPDGRNAWYIEKVPLTTNQITLSQKGGKGLLIPGYRLDGFVYEQPKSKVERNFDPPKPGSSLADAQIWILTFTGRGFLLESKYHEEQFLAPALDTSGGPRAGTQTQEGGAWASQWWATQVPTQVP